MLFVTVCRATPVCPLIVETEEEKRIFSRGEGKPYTGYIHKTSPLVRPTQPSSSLQENQSCPSRHRAEQRNSERRRVRHHPRSLAPQQQIQPAHKPTPRFPDIHGTNNYPFHRDHAAAVPEPPFIHGVWRLLDEIDL